MVTEQQSCMAFIVKTCAHTTKLQNVVVQLTVVLFRNIELQQSIVGLQEGGAERRPLMVPLDGLEAHTCD